MKLETATDLVLLIETKTAEGLRLEFKRKEDPTTPTLSRVDKRNIAQAVSAFANSDGGTLVYGVSSSKSDGGDVADGLSPITNIESFADQFRTVCALNVIPELPNIQTHTIAEDDSTRGYLICEIKRSDSRPHMSVTPGAHSYFRRSFEGSVPMTPSEIRDQILAVRDAILEPQITYCSGGSYSTFDGWISARVPALFRLKNVGRVPARNPFLRVAASCGLQSHSATFDGLLGAYKTEFPYGTLIHVGDQLSCLNLRLTAAVLLDELAVKFANEDIDFSSAVLLLPGSVDHLTSVTDQVSLEEVDYVLSYGAENAPAREKRVSLSRRELAEQLLQQTHVQDVVAQAGIPFRLDLVIAAAQSSARAASLP